MIAMAFRKNEILTSLVMYYEKSATPALIQSRDVLKQLTSSVVTGDKLVAKASYRLAGNLHTCNLD